MTQRRIGEMNGRWALLFKFLLVMVPCSIPLLVWLTSSAWASNDHIAREHEAKCQIEVLIKTHAADMAVLRQEIKEIDRRIDELPPLEWKERIKALELDSRQNREDHATIMIGIEQIKAKLGVIDETRDGT